MVRQFNRLAAGIFAALILSSCTVVVEESRPRPRPIPDEPAFCTRQYDPVCARRGDDRRTFANSCLADAAGYRIIRGGECRRERPRDPIACTREYSPVCAVSQGRTRTFPNACEARAADYRIIDEGPC
ncbi:MAG: peptidase [Rhizobiaceae bacterium]|nr:peptidase [Rhizobiaceae bacterium]